MHDPQLYEHLFAKKCYSWFCLKHKDVIRVADYLDPAFPSKTAVPRHWNNSSPTSYRDSFAVSLDPANKQRDDGCLLAVIPVLVDSNHNARIAATLEVLFLTHCKYCTVLSTWSSWRVSGNIKISYSKSFSHTA